MRLVSVIFVALAMQFGCFRPLAAWADDLEDDPPFLSVGGGYADAYRQRPLGRATEFRVEYRDNHRFFLFKPFVGAMANTNNAFELMGGVRIDAYFGDRIVIMPSFAPSYYDDGDGIKLGHHVEFRSAIEFAYRFDNRARIGVGYSHISNANLGRINPGFETAFIMLSIPLTGFPTE